MELNLESKLKSQAVLEQRKKMIAEENLHINDKIGYATLTNLYKKYGTNLSEGDFAQAFLDMDDIRYANLKKGKNSESIVLSREYVSDEELIAIREKVIQECGQEDKIDYTQLIKMYEKFGGRLSFKLFSEEIFGIPVEQANKLRLTGNRKSISLEFEPGTYGKTHKSKEEFSREILNPDYIKDVRERVISEENLHIGESISYEDLKQLNERYCPSMPIGMFAQDVLDLNISAVNRMKGKNGKSPIFQNINVPEEYIKQVRDKVVILNQLAPNQLLSYNKLQEIYKQYGGLLLERDFAILVLDMPGERYKDIRNGTNESAIILKNEECNFGAIRTRVIAECSLHFDDMIDYEQFQEIHKRYAPNVSESTFAEEVLDINDGNFQNIKYNNGRGRILLNLPQPNPERLDAVRKRVIKECGLHIKDKISYEELRALHSKYAGVMSEEIFATKVLLMQRQSFSRIRTLANNQKNGIKWNREYQAEKALVLYNMEVSQTEIDRVKQEIMTKHNLQKPRKITLDEFQELYDMYGGIMSGAMFSQRILGMSKTSLSKLRGRERDVVTANVRKQFSKGEVATLISYMSQELSETEIAKKMGVTVAFLRSNIATLSETGEISEKKIINERVRVLQEQGKTAKEIAQKVGMPIEDIRKLLAEIESNEKENRKQDRTDKKEKKRKETIEEKARKAIDRYDYNAKGITNVRMYIDECAKDFQEGTFTKDRLDFLMECMTFIQCGFKDIEIFSRICVAEEEYRKAIQLISESIDNEGITQEEKEKLRDLQAYIKYASKKELAVQMLKRGETDVKDIARRAGILEVDVALLRKKMQEDKDQTTSTIPQWR